MLHTIRRKLAQLFSSAHVRELPIKNSAPTASPGPVTLASAGGSVMPGQAIGILSPAILPAGRSSDLSEITIDSANDAVADLADVNVIDATLGNITGQSEALTLDPVNRPPITSVPPIPSDIGRVAAPHFHIAGASVQAADIEMPRKLTKADRRALPLKFKTIRVGLVPSRVAAAIALERRREPMLVTDPKKPPAGFEREMALLKAASGEPDADIKLVGVYCTVPIGAASRLEFDPPTGSLMLNIRENASETIRTTKRPIVTLVLGQIVSTGRMVRAFRPDQA